MTLHPKPETMDLTDVNQLFNYTEWANGLAMDAAAQLPDDSLRRDVSCSHQSIFGTLLHMAGAEWIWLGAMEWKVPCEGRSLVAVDDGILCSTLPR